MQQSIFDELGGVSCEQKSLLPLKMYKEPVWPQVHWSNTIPIPAPCLGF